MSEHTTRKASIVAMCVVVVLLLAMVASTAMAAGTFYWTTVMDRTDGNLNALTATSVDNLWATTFGPSPPGHHRRYSALPMRAPQVPIGLRSPSQGSTSVACSHWTTPTYGLREETQGILRRTQAQSSAGVAVPGSRRTLVRQHTS